MRFSQVKSLSDRLSEKTKVYNNDNLHWIAISNLSDYERQLQRWWTKKYKTPLKPMNEHTIEELIIERLEDYYEANPTEVERFIAGQFIDPEWDGKVSAQHERAILERIKKIDTKNRVDISKYQGPDVSEEEAAKIMADLGLKLPKSSKTTTARATPMLGQDEFEETFEGS